MAEEVDPLLAHLDALRREGHLVPAEGSDLATTRGKLLVLVGELDRVARAERTPEARFRRDGLIYELKRRGVPAPELASVMDRSRTWIYRAVRAYPQRVRNRNDQ